MSSAVAGPSWPGAMSWNSAGSAAGVVLAGKARPPGIAKQSAMMKPELAETSGEAFLLRSRVDDTNSVASTAVAMLADEARSLGFAKHSATAESVPELVESSGEDTFSDQEKQLLHALCNMDRERAMRCLEKLRETRDLPAWLEEGFAELFQRFPSERHTSTCVVSFRHGASSLASLNLVKTKREGRGRDPVVPSPSSCWDAEARSSSAQSF